jgi:hypothetical protein
MLCSYYFYFYFIKFQFLKQMWWATGGLKDNNGCTALFLACKRKQNKSATLRKQAGIRYGITTASTEQEIDEKEGLPGIS